MLSTPSSHRFISGDGDSERPGMRIWGAHSEERLTRRRIKVLIADDEADTVASLKALLEAENCEVLGVYNGESVLREVPKFLPDAVLVDIGMPDITGYVVARVLRALRGAGLLLIAITGRAAYSDEEVAWLAGFDYHLTKPYKADELLALLRGLAGKVGPQTALADFLELRRFEFNAAAIEHAPADQGVYALFEDGELIYIGAAIDNAEHSIRACLQRHRHATPNACMARATHYCWAISSRPRTREAELLDEYDAENGRVPRCQYSAA